ncbi:universal stress protein [Knoellia locipacati]|uniref:Universal stress protein n=1 Tax=Knoellia locipacati TaxID=882824 RepID=A0A512SZH0_9MICO|nr:universal stress protein [Knoellia locipacati]GEQ13352.1 universal stress protein [Knoellia locipacati]
MDAASGWTTGAGHSGPPPAIAHGGPVVVGVDSAPESRAALTWAIEEATRRKRPLHLLHARARQDSSGPVAPGAQDPDPVRTVVETALVRARTVAPDLEVTTQVSDESPATALVAASESASCVVVGSRGRGALTGAVLGTTSAEVAVRASCPVVVVRRLGVVETERPSVVVGTDGSGLSTEAIGYAFAQASLRRLPLTVVHACPSRSSGGYVAPWLSDDPAARVAEEQAATAEEVTGWSEQYPDVRVRRHVLRADPVKALVDHSRGAELLVVGSRGIGGVSGRLVGSVSQGVLSRAHCPVVVVRTGTG